MASKAVENTRTMGIALSSCVIPEVGKPTFFIADDEIEFGMGIHGEKGLEVRKMMTADKITEIIMGKILEDMPLNRNDEVSLMINGLGATPLEEQFIIYRKAAQMLKEIGVHVLMPHIESMQPPWRWLVFPLLFADWTMSWKAYCMIRRIHPFIPIIISRKKRKKI